MGYNITERLALTIQNIKHQRGQCFWDDIEKLELVLDRLKRLEKDVKEYNQNNNKNG